MADMSYLKDSIECSSGGLEVVLDFKEMLESSSRNFANVYESFLRSNQTIWIQTYSNLHLRTVKPLELFNFVEVIFGIFPWNKQYGVFTGLKGVGYILIAAWIYIAKH